MVSSSRYFTVCITYQPPLVEKVQVMSILHTPLTCVEGVNLQLHSFLTWNWMELSVQPRNMTA